MSDHKDPAVVAARKLLYEMRPHWDVLSIADIIRTAYAELTDKYNNAAAWVIQYPEELAVKDKEIKRLRKTLHYMANQFDNYVAVHRGGDVLELSDLVREARTVLAQKGSDDG